MLHTSLAREKRTPCLSEGKCVILPQSVGEVNGSALSDFRRKSGAGDSKSFRLPEDSRNFNRHPNLDRGFVLPQDNIQRSASVGATATDWVRIRPRIARLDARRAELLLSRCKTNVSWTTQREGLPVMKKNTLIAALLGLADGLAAGVGRQRPGHHRHDRRHRHGLERRSAARRHRHGPQRRHRLHPHRAVERGRRLPSRVPADRPLRRGGQPLRIQDGDPQRHRPERQRHRPRGRLPVARRGRRDGECRGRADAMSTRPRRRSRRPSTPPRSRACRSSTATSTRCST